MSDVTLTPTGRELKEPAATLSECVDEAGLKHTLIAFDESYRGHAALTTGVDLIASFLTYPMVTGLVECSLIDTAQGRFGYPTGTIWTLKEVVRGFGQVGQPVGVRAALEMCYLAGMVLFEAGETGPLQGCFSHGNINPWRIGLKADGQLQVFGYGLPQVEMLEFLAGGTKHIDDASILYAPPERLEGQPEQPSSDTYALTVLAVELITGQSLFEGTKGQALWEEVKLAGGVQRMLKHKSIPKAVREVLANALVYDPDTRLQGEAYVAAMGTLLDDAALKGRTLREVMLRMRKQRTTSSRKLVKATATSAFTPADLAALAAAEGEDDDVELEEVGEERWGRTTGRRRRRANAPSGAEPRRRRRRGSEAEPGDNEATDVHTVPEAVLAEAPRPRRRKKPAAAAAPEVAAGEEPTEGIEEAPATKDELPGPVDADLQDAEPPPPPTAEVEEKPTESAPPRRRRRSRPGSGEAAAKSTPPEEEATAPPSRRRRRPAPSEDADEPPIARRRRSNAAESPVPEDATRRRRRRPDPDEATEAPKAESAPKRRRRRRPKDDSEEG